MEGRVARQLFDVAPAQYVEARTLLVRRVRAAGDRATAAALQRLKRPTLAMWALVAAAHDEDAVRRLFERTAALASAQASGDREATVAATAARRVSVEKVTEVAVGLLRMWELAAEARRPEIRTLVDQASRHPELLEPWLDGTLRDLPEGESFGFAAFASLEVRDRSSGSDQAAGSVRPRRPPAGRALADGAAEGDRRRTSAGLASPGDADGPSQDDRPARRLRSVPDPSGTPTRARGRSVGVPAPPDDGAAEQREREERAARAAQAGVRRDAIRARGRAASLLAAATRRLATAEEALRLAEIDLRSARSEHEVAVARHEAAVERVERLAGD